MQEDPKNQIYSWIPGFLINFSRKSNCYFLPEIDCRAGVPSVVFLILPGDRAAAAA